MPYIDPEDHDDLLPESPHQEWNRHVSRQPVYTIGPGEPMELVGQFTFKDDTEVKHAVTMCYLVEKAEERWGVIWTTDQPDGTYGIENRNQFWRESPDAASEEIEQLVDEITSHRKNPRYNADIILRGK